MSDEVLKIDKNGQWKIKNEPKGVHRPIHNPAMQGQSVMGRYVRLGPEGKAEAREEASRTLKDIKNMPKPKLAKALSNGQWTTDETLQKTPVKRDALKRLARDLAAHSSSVDVHHVKVDKDMIERNNTPHPEGIVGFDVTHPAKSKEAVDRILEAHGHFNHSNAFGEHMDNGDDTHTQYGTIQLHPEHAKHLVEGAGFSGTRPEGADIAPVQDPAIGSMNLYEGSATGEGNAKGAKWQGSDPRKNANFQREQTRASQPIAQPASGQIPGAKAATAGVSQRGYSRTETGKPVKLIKSLPNGQWTMDETLEKSVYNAGMHPPKGYVPGQKQLKDTHAEYDPKYSFKDNRELVRMHHQDHKIPVKDEAHLDSLTRAAAKRGEHVIKE